MGPYSRIKRKTKFSREYALASDRQNATNNKIEWFLKCLRIIKWKKDNLFFCKFQMASVLCQNVCWIQII